MRVARARSDESEQGARAAAVARPPPCAGQCARAGESAAVRVHSRGVCMHSRGVVDAGIAQIAEGPNVQVSTAAARRGERCRAGGGTHHVTRLRLHWRARA